MLPSLNKVLFLLLLLLLFSDDDIKRASDSDKRRLYSAIDLHHPCQTPMFLLALKLYDALETHSQFNLSNALPGHCVIEFIKETISKNKGKGKGVT